MKHSPILILSRFPRLQFIMLLNIYG